MTYIILDIFHVYIAVTNLKIIIPSTMNKILYYIEQFCFSTLNLEFLLIKKLDCACLCAHTTMCIYLRYNKISTNSNIPSKDFQFFYQLSHNKCKC